MRRVVGPLVETGVWEEYEPTVGPDAAYELGPDFMCFEWLYRAVASVVPHDWTVIDIGCAAALQGKFFEGYAGYVSVDLHEGLGRIPGTCLSYMPRYRPRNGHEVVMPGELFARRIGRLVGSQKAIAVVSNVPCEAVYGEVFANFENYACWYTGNCRRTRFGGIYAEEIMEAFIEMRRADMWESDPVQAKLREVEGDFF